MVYIPDWTEDIITRKYLDDVCECEYTFDQEDVDMDKYFEEKNND